VTRDDIPTPALLLDLDRFDRNLRAAAAHVRAAGKQLRPHAKTHKCPEIARRQVAAGATGVVCAKLAEAEVMAASGISGLLISTEVVGDEKIGRLMRLLDHDPGVLVVVDHPDNVRDLAHAARAAGHVLGVLVDVDVGGRRTGTGPGEPALALARAVAAAPSLRFRGLQGYAGQCAHIVGWAARREAAVKAMTPLIETRRLLEARGIPVEIVSGGSTGTYDIDSDLEGLTELQCGSYCVMDLDYLRIGGRTGDRLTDFEMALTVLATVVSVPAPDLAIVDAGLKAFATDRPFGPEPVERRLRVRRGRTRAPAEPGPARPRSARRAGRVLPAALRSDDEPVRPCLRDAGRTRRGRVGHRRARQVTVERARPPRGSRRAPGARSRPGPGTSPRGPGRRPGARPRTTPSACGAAATPTARAGAP
jgi:D-serine deaminase-like pyridoxal phosphate-dependent protein